MPRLLSRAVLLTLLAALLVPAAAARAVRPLRRAARPDQRVPAARHADRRDGHADLAARRAAEPARAHHASPGSKSGRHSGRLRAHSDGQGASFVLKPQAQPGGAGHRADRSPDPRDAQRRLHVPHGADAQAGDAPEPDPGEHQREADALVPLPSRPRAAVPHGRPAPARDRARLPVPEPEVEEGPEAGGPDDLRRQRRADLVPPAARHPGRHRLPHPDLPGQAGADLLAGHLADRHRHRRAGDARPVLPGHPPHPLGQRLQARPARVRGHAATARRCSSPTRSCART